MKYRLTWRTYVQTATHKTFTIHNSHRSDSIELITCKVFVYVVVFIWIVQLFSLYFEYNTQAMWCLFPFPFRSEWRNIKFNDSNPFSFKINLNDMLKPCKNVFFTGVVFKWLMHGVCFYRYDIYQLTYRCHGAASLVQKRKVFPLEVPITETFFYFSLFSCHRKKKPD